MAGARAILPPLYMDFAAGMEPFRHVCVPGRRNDFHGHVWQRVDPNLCYTVFVEAEMASSNRTDHKDSMVNGGQILDSSDACSLIVGLDIELRDRLYPWLVPNSFPERNRG